MQHPDYDQGPGFTPNDIAVVIVPTTYYYMPTLKLCACHSCARCSKVRGCTTLQIRWTDKIRVSLLLDRRVRILETAILYPTPGNAIIARIGMKVYADGGVYGF